MPLPSSSDELFGVACTSVSWCVAVGTALYQRSGNDSLVEMFDGSTWSIVPSPDVPGWNYLQDVSCVNSDYCMAVGFSEGNVYSTLAEMWNGSKWSIVPSPNPGTDQTRLEGVDCTSITNCVAVGSYASASYTYPLIEAWNGSTWSIADEGTGAPNALGSVSCVGTDFCMAVGTSSLTWNGTDWSVTGPINTSGTIATSVSCISSSSCEAVLLTDEGETEAASFDGNQWSIQSTPQVGGTLKGVTCFDSSDCLAVGAASSETLIESFTGATWSVVASPDPGTLVNGLTGLSCVSSSACAAVGAQASGGSSTLAMEWDGTQWSTSPTQNDGVFPLPDSGPPGTVILVSGGGFQPDEQVTVTYTRRSPMCDALASSDGSFSCTGVVPQKVGAPNLDSIIARGETSGIKAKANFYPK